MPIYTLTNDIIKSARERATENPKGDYEYIDRSNPRLMIRVRNGKAAWSEKSRSGKARIAALDVFSADDLPVLRQLVERIKTKRELGWTTEEINVLIAKFVASPQLGVDHADNEANSQDWRWERLRDEFLDGPKGIKHRVPLRTYSNHRSFLGAVPDSVYALDLKTLNGRVIKNITQLDIEHVAERIFARGRGERDDVKDTTRKRDGMYNTARLVQESIKAAFHWGVTNSAITGLTSDPTARLAPILKPRERVREILPSDLHKLTGLMPASAEEIRGLKRPNILVEKEYLSPKEIYDFHLWLRECEDRKKYPIDEIRVLHIQSLTAQRISTVCGMIRAMVRKVVDEEFQMVWYLGPDKNGKMRALPLPYFAGFHARMACRDFDLGKDNLSRTIFAFHKKRHRHAGDDMNVPLGKEGPTAILADARRPGGPFHTSRMHVTSHSFRAALISNLKNRWNLFGLGSEDATEMITHSEEGKISTSDLFYNHDPNFRAKYHILKVWQDLIYIDDPHYDSTDIREMLASSRRAIRATEEEEASMALFRQMQMEG